MTWIVMTSCAAVPGSWTWKHEYRNVALVRLTQEYTAKGLIPKMISDRAKGVLRIIHMGHYPVGKTERAAFQRAYAEAEERAHRLNNSAPEAWPGEIMTWGGSA